MLFDHSPSTHLHAVSDQCLHAKEGCCLTVLIQIGLQASDELSFVSLGFQTSGLTLLPQLSQLKQPKKQKRHLIKQVPCEMCEALQVVMVEKIFTNVT